MIARSHQFDLGLDRTRMKDPKDALRQHATVDALLKRLFSDDIDSRREIQILADEVGMGKTFVALGLAYSVLSHLQTMPCPDELRGCYRRVLVITPQNSALFKKWQREVSEFVRRCVHPQFRETADRWFKAEAIERLDDLAVSLRRKGPGPSVTLITTALFAGGKLLNYDLKRRFLLGVLFRYWGNRFRIDRRERLLKGAPAGWPAKQDEIIGALTEREDELLPFDEDELRSAIDELDPEGIHILDRLLETCLEISELYVRDRAEKFSAVERLLVDVYRRASEKMIRKAFPLIIVDEAHNWKNGPRSGANGFRDFSRFIAPNARRALLLTATPFQLRPDEVLEILKVSDFLSAAPTRQTSEERRMCLERDRENIIRPVLANSARASEQFSKAWAKLSPARSDTAGIEMAWKSPCLEYARRELNRVAAEPGVVSDGKMTKIIEPALQNVDPEIRKLLREALYLYAYNRDLSHELGAFVVRHRRHTDHRLFRVGSEFSIPVNTIAKRPDSHLLHAAPGMDVVGPGELPHYLLMRCITEMKGGKGRSSLCSDLTGCYSTLLDSAEGKALKDLKEVPRFQLLMELVDERQDPAHPKVKPIVDRVMSAWRCGEKSLLFCFRTNTARRLREIIDSRIRSELEAQRKRCLGGESALRALRGRLTGRDRDLIPLGLDRVLWSLFLAEPAFDCNELPFYPTQLTLTDRELLDLARLALRFDIDIGGERVDRVFLNRATEHILAQRFLSTSVSRKWRSILCLMADEAWVRSPYGLEARDDTATTPDEERDEPTDFDERGVHTRYEATNETSDPIARELATTLMERRQRALQQGQIPVLDVYAKGPSLWLGSNPQEGIAQSNAVVGGIHSFLHALTFSKEEVDWATRLQTFQALRRALFRESVLLRLLPEKCEQEESGWGHLLVDAFFAPLPNQSESMADRIAIFLEDLQASSGEIDDPSAQRHIIYESTKLRDQQFVALVDGNSKSDVRDRVFAGFNTPLLPEVLICTSVGQEGIDLHRHCRHVIHYDLAWNPAVLEQRTGRVDRIGSKTFRERAAENDGQKTYLEIGVPFLAGTYDERMYEELRIRAQTFEVLTGGDLAVENAEGVDCDGKDTSNTSDLDFVILPQRMIEELRVRLEVWKDDAYFGRSHSAGTSEYAR